MRNILKILIVVFLASIPSFAALEVDSNEVLITVTNVPVNEPSIFIPITLSSEDLDLYQIQLKDIFIKGYLASIERDENKKVIGVSFAALRTRSLPDKLEAIIKVKPIRFAETNRKAYPKTVALVWEAPWVYTKPTKKVAGSYAGFSGIGLAANDRADLTQKEKKQRRKEQDNRSNDFYIKSFGQPLVRGQRSNNKLKEETEFLQMPLVKELSIFTNTPSEGNYEKLYIPMMIEHTNLLKVEVINSNLAQGVVLRILDNNSFELAALNNASLPNNFLVKGKISLMQNEKSLLNELKLGPILSEPSRPLTGMQVIINPSAITVKYSDFNPLNLFE